ncbi:MAG: T9SS type A sorting domain-containing protein [Bacteroidetes bacterium]|nr:T9SS type A sorting domain-containing protein [Bacteroidota bacterium]
MKITIKLLALLFVFTNLYSQNASTYFPSATGYKWYYKNTPLDSLNNPVNSLSTFQVDSFAANVTYNGLPAALVVSKSGLTSINQNSPYTDSSYYNFQSTNGFYYLNVLNFIGTIPGIDSVAFINFLRSFESWYSFYRFSQTVNTNYTIFSKDTTVSFDTLTLPLRLSLTGRRLNDQTISTVNGNIACKKFQITFALSYGLLPPIIYIPIVSIPDTVYIAQNIWVARDVTPSVNVDLSSIGVNLAFSIPGSQKELTQSAVGISGENTRLPEGFSLSQNYPNPFNPSTVISYELQVTSFAKLIVYDMLGNEVASLVNEKQDAGYYSIEFDGSGFPSGVYYYKLETEGFSDVKKMILVK